MREWIEDDFVGGHPALDFVNTVDGQDKSRDRTRLTDWQDFQSWALASGLFDTSPTTVDSDLLLMEIHELREVGFAVLNALAHGHEVPDEAEKLLMKKIRDALSRAAFVHRGEAFSWEASGQLSTVVVDRLALAFEALLRSDELKRLRECGRCSWLFLDHGRGRGRRWCNMKTCGNRAKVETFRSR